MSGHVLTLVLNLVLTDSLRAIMVVIAWSKCDKVCQ
jgi:hypothetical protein